MLTNRGGWVTLDLLTFTTQPGYDFVYLYAGSSKNAALLALLSGATVARTSYSSRDGKPDYSKHAFS